MEGRRIVYLVLFFFHLTVLFAPVNGQCDLQAVVACMPTEQPSAGNQCAMFRTLQICLEPYRAGCASDSTFQTMTSAFNQLGAICGGSSGSSGGSNGQCDLAAVGKCMEGAQLPSADTKDLQAACASFNEILTCLKRYESDCASVQIFQQSKGAIDAVAPYCAGGAACNPMKCFTDAGLDPTGMSNLTCDLIPQVKTCITKLSTACVGNAVYPSIVQSIEAGEKACSQGAYTTQAMSTDQHDAINQIVPSSGAKKNTIRGEEILTLRAERGKYSQETKKLKAEAGYYKIKTMYLKMRMSELNKDSEQ